MHTYLKRGFLALLGVSLLAQALPVQAFDVAKAPFLKLYPDYVRLEEGKATLVTVEFDNNSSLQQADFPVVVTYSLKSMTAVVNGVEREVTDCETAGVSFVTDASATALPSPCIKEMPPQTFETTMPGKVYLLVTKPTTLRIATTVKVQTSLAGPVMALEELHASTQDGPTTPSIAGMRPDPLVTTFGHLTIRARDLLGYALRMKQDLTSNKADNPIFKMYEKSRRIANLLFVIALMFIAFFYNFAILISRERLKRLLILFAIAIVGVNFSYTMASIAIQGSDRLFNVLLVRDDATGETTSGGDLNGNGKIIVSGSQVTEEDLLTMKNFTYTGFVGAVKPDPVDRTLPPDEINDLSNNRARENIFFNLALMTAGAIGQFAVVLVLLARIMILWALIIVAPFFFLLAIFKFSQEIFKYWGWFFFRWLLVGPLLALFLSANVRIWTSAAGIPISSSYDRATMNTFMPNIMNIWVGAPGVRGAEGLNLETPDQVIRYLMGLMMLYLAVLLPFWLTRRILVFSPEKPSLLSKLLGGNHPKVRQERQRPEPTVPPKSPLKSGFTFNEAAVGAAVGAAVAKGVAAAGARAGAAATAATAATSRAAATGRVDVAASASASVTSAAGEAVRRQAARRLSGSSVRFADLASREKPRAVSRNTDANVQAALRTATKSAVSSAQLASLTNAELGELRTSLAGLASSSVLGTSVATNAHVSDNLRTIERESQSRAEHARSERAIRVKVQGLADRASKTALDASDLAILRLTELQALKSEIESRVAADSALKQNTDLHATYDHLVAEISTHSLSAIAGIVPAITAQTGAIVAAISRAEVVPALQLSALNVPELKEVSLAVHRMERAVRSQAALAAVRANLSALQAAQPGRPDGELDSARVESILAKAAAGPLAAEELAALSGRDLAAAAAELSATSALGTAVQVAVAVDAGTPAYKETVVNVHAELAARERAEDAADTRARNPQLVSALLHRILAGSTVGPAELVSLALPDLRALNRFVAVVGETGGDADGPDGPDTLGLSAEAIEHEQQQRLVLEKRMDAETRVQLAAAYRKVRAGQALTAADLAPLGSDDLDWLHDRVSELLAKARGEQTVLAAVSGIQGELRARRMKELSLAAERQSPKVAELFAAVTTGAEVKGAALATLALGDLRLLVELAERAASLLPQKLASAAAFTGSLRRIETAFQKKSLGVLVQKVLEASPAAQAVLTKLRAADTLSAAELENLTLPELEAVQAESYRMNLQAPAAVKTNAVYQDNLALVTQIYDARVIEHAVTGGSEDGRFRFITGLQDAVGATLAQKIAELKAANKDDEAIELVAQQDDLSALVDRSAELAAERAEWIEYFKITPVPKVEGIRSRTDWIEAERTLTHAIYEEIASQDWVLQAKGIADAAANLLMNDTSSMSPVQILTALAVKEAAAGEALQLVRDDDELVSVPVAVAAPALATAPLRTFDDDDATDRRQAEIRSAVDHGS